MATLGVIPLHRVREVVAVAEIKVRRRQHALDHLDVAVVVGQFGGAQVQRAAAKRHQLDIGQPPHGLRGYRADVLALRDQRQVVAGYQPDAAEEAAVRLALVRVQQRRERRAAALRARLPRGPVYHKDVGAEPRLQVKLLRGRVSGNKLAVGNVTYICRDAYR